MPLVSGRHNSRPRKTFVVFFERWQLLWECIICHFVLIWHRRLKNQTFSTKSTYIYPPSEKYVDPFVRNNSRYSFTRNTPKLNLKEILLDLSNRKVRQETKYTFTYTTRYDIKTRFPIFWNPLDATIMDNNNANFKLFLL